MRVALTGTVSVGKTSVVERIAATRLDVTAVPETARIYFDHNPKDAHNHGSYSVQHAIASIGLGELVRHRPTPHTLFDRTPLDAAAYYLSLTGDKDFARLMASGYATAVKQLDKVVMLSMVGVEMVEDGLRNQSVRKRALFEEALDDIYRHEEIDYEVIHGSLDERTDKILTLFPAQITEIAV